MADQQVQPTRIGHEVERLVERRPGVVTPGIGLEIEIDATAVVGRAIVDRKQVDAIIEALAHDDERASILDAAQGPLAPGSTVSIASRPCRVVGQATRAQDPCEPGNEEPRGTRHRSTLALRWHHRAVARIFRA